MDYNSEIGPSKENKGHLIIKNGRAFSGLFKKWNNTN